jgi:uncharacterized protein (TIGR02594 family)
METKEQKRGQTREFRQSNLENILATRGIVGRNQMLQIMLNEVGVMEIKGSEHNPRILQYANDSFFESVDDETAWCSIIVNWAAKLSGLQSSKSKVARSWMNVGKEVDVPEIGDVVVFWREKINSWKGHVGLFIGFSDDEKIIYCLGGNQSNTCCIMAYSTLKLLGFRKLQKENYLKNTNN